MHSGTARSTPRGSVVDRAPKSPRRVWLWWSSGKDSAWSLWTLQHQTDIHVERLITTVTPTFDRVAIHGTRRSILRAQARSSGLGLEEIELPFPCTNDQYEAAVAPTLLRAQEEGVDAMAFGDLFLADVRDYRLRLLEGSGVEGLFPLWGRDTQSLAREVIDSGVEAYITSLDPTRVDRTHAGRPYDEDFLKALPDDVDPCGENGEFHTCVVGGPMLEPRLSVTGGEVVERSGFVYADLLLDGE